MSNKVEGVKDMSNKVELTVNQYVGDVREDHRVSYEWGGDIDYTVLEFMSTQMAANCRGDAE